MFTRIKHTNLIAIILIMVMLVMTQSSVVAVDMKEEAQPKVVTQATAKPSYVRGVNDIIWGKDIVKPNLDKSNDGKFYSIEDYVPLNNFIKYDVKHKTEKWFSDEYIANNIAIKEYADRYASFTFHGTVIDGMAIMAQANTESVYMADRSQTLTALYPSTFIPFTGVEDIENCNVTKIWGNKDTLNGVYFDVNEGCTLGPLYAWSTGAGVFEQGPLQTRVSEAAANALFEEGCASEYDKLLWSGVMDSMYNTLYGYEASVYCLGSDYVDYKFGFKTTGDRWAIKDNCIMYKTDKQAQLEQLWDLYYKDCGYIPNKYECLAVLSYCHWIPSVILGVSSEETAQYYGFSHINSWHELCHQLSTAEALSIIRNYAYDAIDENRELFYSGQMTKEDAMRTFQPVINHGSTDYVENSIPWQIFNELAEKGIVDKSLVILQPEYGYQHAMKYAIMYLYAYEMLDILLVEGY